MTEEEKKAQEELQKRFDALKADIQKAIEEENAEKLQKAILEAQQKAEEQIKKLQTELDNTKEQFSAFEVKVKKAEINTLSGFISKNNEALKEVAAVIKKKGETKAYLQLSEKIIDTTAIEDGSAVVITRSQTNFASNLQLAQQPAVERIDSFDVFMDSGVTLVPLTGNATSVPYIDEVTTGDADTQGAEGLPKPEIDVKYVEQVAYTKTYAGIIGVSDQMLEDIILLQTWIFAMLRRKLQASYNNAFFNGVGTGGEMHGLVTLATAFDSTGLELGAGAAVGIYEVINAAITQARVSNFNATRVWMNPIDYYKMISERSDQGRVNSIVESQVLNGYIGTARIQLTNYVAANTLIVAEAEVIKVIYRSNMFGMPEIGLNGEDFKNNMKSIRAHARLENVLEDNNAPGVVYVSDISAAITAIASDPL